MRSATVIGTFVLVLCSRTTFAEAEKPAGYRAQILPIPTSVAQEMRKHSFKDACPVPLEDLAYLRLSHWDFQGNPQQGELVVHRGVAEDVRAAFEELYEAGFRIEKMRLIDHYSGSDAASMADNNTSAFNCRPITGRRGGFSKHSYGIAIDINPKTNPYVKGSKVLPPSGEVYADRTQKAPGLIVSGDACHTAFTSRGWSWGGAWRSVKDYQHFETQVPP